MTSPLTRRPKAMTMSVEEVVDSARRGDVRIPRFQRPFRWNDNDIRALFDSISRGYPVGAIIFWRRPQPAARVEFGPVEVDAPESSSTFLVVDGQQRITSLVAALLHPAPGKTERDKYEVYYDLEVEKFVSRPSRRPVPSQWLPLNVVLDAERLQAWLDSYAGRTAHPEHFSRAIRVGKQIREYQLPVYVVDTDDEQTLVEIFDRLNSRGRRLEREEVFEALHGGPGAGQPTSLTDLGAAVADLQFGDLGKDWLLKVVLATRGLDVSRDFRDQIRGIDRSVLFREAADALRRAIVFLKTDVGIPRAVLLPYRFPVIPLVRFFYLHPQPHARSRELLSRWVWRGAATEAHGAGTPEIRRSVALVDLDEEESVQRLLRQVSPAVPKFGADDLNDYRFSSARAKIAMNALIMLAPRDLRTGDPIDAVALIASTERNALQPIFSSSSPASKALRESTANRLIHPRISSRQLIHAIIDRGAAGDRAVLRSHCIPIEAVDHLLTNNADRFLLARTDLLVEEIRIFLEKKGRPHETDRKSIAALIVADDDDGARVDERR